MTRRALYIDCSPDAARQLADLDAELSDGLDVHHGDPDANDLASLLAGYPLVLNGHTRMPAELLNALSPDLRRIVFLGAGAANYIDLETAEALGIVVRVVRGYGDRSVAEHAFALLLAAARDVAAMDRALRNGDWLQAKGMELRGKTLGLVGYGGVGAAMAEMAHGFGLRVLVWNRRPVDLPDWAARAVDLAALFGAADAVSLHLAYTPETRNLIGAELFGALRPGAILVNTARAEVVDRDALVAALRDGPLAHAAIDVFEPEPPAPDDPLLALANVTLTAHAAWKTPDASRRLLQLGVEQLWSAARS